MIPIPEFVLDGAVLFLKNASAETVSALFTLAGTPHYREGFVFALPNVVIEVADACSGIRSSIGLLLASLLAGHLFLRTRVEEVGSGRCSRPGGDSQERCQDSESLPAVHLRGSGVSDGTASPRGGHRILFACTRDVGAASQCAAALGTASDIERRCRKVSLNDSRTSPSDQAVPTLCACCHECDDLMECTPVSLSLPMCPGLQCDKHKRFADLIRDFPHLSRGLTADWGDVLRES